MQYLVINTCINQGHRIRWQTNCNFNRFPGCIQMLRLAGECRMCGLGVFGSVELCGVLSPTPGPEDPFLQLVPHLLPHVSATPGLSTLGGFPSSALFPSALLASSESLFSCHGFRLALPEHLLLPASLLPAGTFSPTAGSDAFREERGRKEKARAPITCPVQHTHCQLLAEFSQVDLGKVQLTHAGTVKANILPAPAGSRHC